MIVGILIGITLVLVYLVYIVVSERVDEFRTRWVATSSHNL